MRIKLMLPAIFKATAIAATLLTLPAPDGQLEAKSICLVEAYTTDAPIPTEQEYEDFSRSMINLFNRI